MKPKSIAPGRIFDHVRTPSWLRGQANRATSRQFGRDCLQALARWSPPYAANRAVDI